MITGSVSAKREATILLQLQGPAGQEHQIEAVIDTGFTGRLLLPPAVVANLGLQSLGRGGAVLADGSTTVFNVYEVTVDWNGQLLTVPVHEADGDPLVGMALLYGCELRVQVIDGGTVTIEALP